MIINRIFLHIIIQDQKLLSNYGVGTWLSSSPPNPVMKSLTWYMLANNDFNHNSTVPHMMINTIFFYIIIQNQKLLSNYGVGTLLSSSPPKPAMKSLAWYMLANNDEWVASSFFSFTNKL